MEAIAALEHEADDGVDSIDWADVADEVAEIQPHIAARIRALARPVTRHDLIRTLGTLHSPFTLIATEINMLDLDPVDFWANRIKAAEEEVSEDDDNDA